MTHASTNVQPGCLPVDKKQALRQLTLLGYQEGDNVYLRQFPPKGIAGKAKTFKCVYPDIPTSQSSDGGLYFVVNGGGQKDADVTQGKAIFFEHDDRPKAEQVLIWQDKDLPEPTLQVSTRKSIHSYYTISDGCTVEQWKELQLDLLEHVDGDRTLKNPSRVMRLASSLHIPGKPVLEKEPDAEPICCELIHEGTSYSYAELRAAIPPRQKSEPKQSRQSKKVPSTNSTHEQLSDILHRDILPRLKPKQIYNWPGHNWENTRSDMKLRGYCPWHDSRSGTAFHIEPHGNNDSPLWHCPSCNIGGGAVEYRDRLRGGNGSPRGKAWVEIVQELAAEAGITLPANKFSKGKTEALGNTGQPQKLVPLAANYRKLKDIVEDRLKLNSLTKDIEFDGEPVTLDGLEMYLALKYNAQFKSFLQISTALAKENQYSPVVNYLNEVSQKYGDDTKILEGFAQRYFNVSEPILQTFIQKWLISTVARAYNPGCKVDTALILQGAQGVGKSSFFKVLSNGWFDDSVGNVGDKDERLKLHRAWIIEWSELETIFRRKDISSVKAFLTSSVDYVRPPYGRSVEVMKRQSVIVGTTNEDDFLRDPTGNRRFWIIPVSSAINIELLRSECDRIWAAAAARYHQGEEWWLNCIEADQAEQINEQFKASDPWEDAIVQWLKNNPSDTVTTSQILTNCLQVDVSRHTPRDQARVAGILKGKGYTPKIRMISGERKRLLVRDPHTSHVDDEANVTSSVTAEN